MSRPFAVFDIDGTLIRWQLFHAIVDRLAKAGHISPEAYQKAHDARMRWKRRSHTESFHEYEQQLVHMYIDELVHLRVIDFQKAANDVFAEHKDQVYTYTRDLIRDLKAKNYILFAISASQSEIVGMLADYYGFDDYAATVYEHQAGRFTGKISAIAHKKPDALKELMIKHHVTADDSIGVGDSGSDITMLEMTERPIAFNPTRDLLQHARAAGWKVVVERKNVIYELEAYNGTYILAQTNS